MANTIYTATDTAGTVHKRTTASRIYTHTVVVKGGYNRAMSHALSSDHTMQDERKFALETLIATGHDPCPDRVWLAVERGDKPADIVAEAVRVAERNAKRLTDAKAIIEGHKVETYCAAERVKRVADVGIRKAAGEFDTWRNAGWCGRLDLAQKLANSQCATGDYIVAILEAKEV